jgi:hypothetical protein
MHEHMARLYEAAEQLKGITGQSAVARLLNVSPQRLGNWEDRGISFEGMIDAQERIGCNAVWIRKGLGPMKAGDPIPMEKPDGLAEALKLTCESAAELQMLSVYRLSNDSGRKLINHAVDQVRQDLGWSNSLNEPK